MGKLLILLSTFNNLLISVHFPELIVPQIAISPVIHENIIPVSANEADIYTPSKRLRPNKILITVIYAKI